MPSCVPRTTCVTSTPSCSSTNSNDARILPSQFDRYDEAGEADAVHRRGRLPDVVHADRTGSGVDREQQPLPEPGRLGPRLVHRGTWADLIWVEGTSATRWRSPTCPSTSGAGTAVPISTVPTSTRSRTAPSTRTIPGGTGTRSAARREHLELAPVEQQRRPDRLQPLRGGDDLGRRTSRSSHAAGFGAGRRTSRASS